MGPQLHHILKHIKTHYTFLSLNLNIKSQNDYLSFRFAFMWFQVTNACRYNFTWADPTEMEFSRIEIPAIALKARLWIVEVDFVLSTDQV
jgi:hypothetical protein